MSNRQIIDKLNDYYKKVDLIRRPLLNYARSKIYGVQNAEDIVQNTILILCQKMNEFDANKSFHGWAFKICNFQIKKYLTALKRRKEESYADPDEFSDKQEPGSVEKIISDEKLADRINNIKLLKLNLPPKQSEVFSYILNGSSRLEARKFLNMKKNNFNTTYSRVIKNCIKILKKESA